MEAVEEEEEEEEEFYIMYMKTGRCSDVEEEARVYSMLGNRAVGNFHAWWGIPGTGSCPISLPLGCLRKASIAASHTARTRRAIISSCVCRHITPRSWPLGMAAI